MPLTPVFSKRIAENLRAINVPESLAHCHGNMFVGNTLEDLIEALDAGFRYILISKKPQEEISFFEHPDPHKSPEKHHMLSIVCEGRVIHNTKAPEAIASFFEDQSSIDKKTAMTFRLVLQESLSNAVEHGNLGVSSKAHKEINQDTWFNNYYDLVDELLGSDKGLKPVAIHCHMTEDILSTTVEDQGKGFDVSESLAKIMPDTPYGKGLALANALSERTLHSKNGCHFLFEIVRYSEQNLFAPPSRASAKQHGKILVVDDQKINRDLAKHILKGAGYKNIELATSGEEAIEKINASPPDVILLDIIMEGLDGFEVCQILKANPKTTDIPVLFLSGLTDAKNRTKGYRLGAVDYVNKPIDTDELIARTDIHILNGLMLRSMQDLSHRLLNDLKNARRFQTNLLPKEDFIRTLSKEHNLSITSTYRACEELAGDYWSLFNIDEKHIAITLADFTGHGVLAAMNTTHLHSLFHEFAYLLKTPERLIFELNSRLEKTLNVEVFATNIYGVLNTETGVFSYVCNGSMPIIHISKNKSTPVKLLNCSGVPLGLVESSALTMHVKNLNLKKGDTLFFYSDAFVETLHKDGTMWDEEKLLSAVELCRNPLLPGTILARLQKLFNNTATKPLKDDLTLITITYKPT